MNADDDDDNCTNGNHSDEENFFGSIKSRKSQTGESERYRSVWLFSSNQVVFTQSQHKSFQGLQLVRLFSHAGRLFAAKRSQLPTKHTQSECVSVEAAVEMVSSIRFLRVHLTNTLTCSTNSMAVIKHLCILKKLQRAGVNGLHACVERPDLHLHGVVQKQMVCSEDHRVQLTPLMDIYTTRRRTEPPASAVTPPILRTHRSPPCPGGGGCVASGQKHPD